MQPIKWGVLGASKFALEHMARAIHAASGAELTALATSNAQKALPFLDFCPTLKVYEDYDSLLCDPEIDAIYIPLPNHLHVEWTLKAIAAGKHVLCEKPIALHANEIDQIIKARDDSGLVVAEAYMILHHPQWQRAKEWLDEGRIGTLRHVDAIFSYNNESAPQNIRNRSETGGGSLRDIGVYTLGACRYVTGAEPKSVSARIRLENNVEVFAQIDAIMAKAKEQKGFSFNSITSMRLSNRQSVTFQGDKGMICVSPAPFNANVHSMAAVELHHANQIIIDRFPDVNQYVLQVESFCRSIREKTPYPCSLEFVQGTQRMMDMAHDNATQITL